MNKVSILIVNFNTADFIKLSLYALKKLTKNNYSVFIVDNGSNLKDYEKLKREIKKYDNVLLERWKTNLRGSIAHGTALNYLVKKVNTPYFSILDADATWLIKNWDEILINKIDDEIKIIGTQAPKPKPQDFPLMFAIILETKVFKRLNVDFRPKNILAAEDTGYELRNKYLEAGYRSINIEFKNVKEYKKGPFKNFLVVAEYYLNNDYKNIIASHFGRGSSLGRNKYVRLEKFKFIYSIPFVRERFLKYIGMKEKKDWIKICKKIIDEQTGLDRKKYEELKECLFCHSKDIDLILESPDRLSGSNGIFYLSKCKECGLVFQNPRVKEKFINDFYSDNLVYFKNGKKNNNDKKNAKELIKRMLPKKMQYFLKKINNSSRKRKIKLEPDFIKNGKLLEIGCAGGEKLEYFKDNGWNVYGIEKYKKVANYAKEKRGLNVQCSRIEDVNFKNQEFNVIIMSMVLEHLYNPFDVLKVTAKWLKSDGVLFFSIPYFDGFSFRFHGNYSYGLQLPTHITFLNKKIIKKTLVELGYSKIEFYFQSNVKDFIMPFRYKYKDTGKNIYKFFGYNRFFKNFIVKPLIYLLSLLGITSRVSVYAKK